MTRVGRLINLPAGRRRVLVEAVVRLTLVNLAAPLFGFRRLCVMLSCVTPSPLVQGSVPPDEWAEVAAWAVRAAACHGPIRANCLPRSLTLWWMLRRRGLAPQLRLGARRTATGIEGHAWVEIQGIVLNDRPDVARDFSPLFWQSRPHGRLGVSGIVGSLTRDRGG